MRRDEGAVQRRVVRVAERVRERAGQRGRAHLHGRVRILYSYSYLRSTSTVCTYAADQVSRICAQTLRGGAGAARGHGHAGHEGPRADGGAVRERELRAAARSGRLALRHPLLHAQELPGHHHALHRVGARQGTTRHPSRASPTPTFTRTFYLHAPHVFVLLVLVLHTRYEYMHSTLTSLSFSTCQFEALFSMRPAVYNKFWREYTTEAQLEELFQVSRTLESFNQHFLYN